MSSAGTKYLEIYPRTMADVVKQSPGRMFMRLQGSRAEVSCASRLDQGLVAAYLELPHE